MAADLKPEAWTVSANDCLQLSLVDSNGAVNFKPTFTYPIYGDSEQIFGYKDLKIFLAFDSVTFKPFVNVKYEQRLNDGIEDVKQLLLNKLPKADTVVSDESAWVDTFQKERETFQLPENSNLLTEYQYDGETFSIFKVSISDPAIKKLHDRMQIFTLLFIESASYIDDTDPGWEVFIIFNKATKQCIGYTTTYQFWRYQGSETFDSASHTHETRAKISQFLILPPYQGKHHGQMLYKSIIEEWMNDRSIIEITVEDPNESFDDLRDRCDLERILRDRSFDDYPNELPLNSIWAHKKQMELKMEKRQFMRILEMYLRHMGSANYRLQVKKRIYEKNYEALMDMDDSTRNDKLQTAFLSVTEDYDRILSKVKLMKRMQKDQNQPGTKKVRT